MAKAYSPMLKLFTISALAVAFVVCAAGDLLGAGAETGTTSVSMSIEGSHLEIELTTDPETLLARLDRRAGRVRAESLPNESPNEPPIESLADAIVRRETELFRHVVVQFDDRVAPLRVATVTAATLDAADESSSSRVKIRLSAAVPDGARSVRWTYALASAAYPLTVRQRASVTSETIAGADPSIPVTLLDTQRPDATRGFWALFVPALFAALITLRVRERRSR